MPRCLALLLVIVAAAWPGSAGAVRFIGEAPGPPVGTTIDGFTEVLGPSATEPEHAGEFGNPAGLPVCIDCPPAAPKQDQPPPRPGQP
ncbi:MAG TPA: hypothetical protein VMB34_05620 [Acetobacteraceae bacterium]|nr:hypothetical protein [Acetobacteraceae bacterium]